MLVADGPHLPSNPSEISSVGWYGPLTLREISRVSQKKMVNIWLDPSNIRQMFAETKNEHINISLSLILELKYSLI